MLKNYFVVALRNLLKHKFYSFINIFGLTIGITCCLLIVAYVSDELSYDKQHPNVENMYRLAIDAQLGGAKFNAPQFSAPAAEALVNDFPEVEKSFRFREQGSFLVRYNDPSGIKSFKEDNVIYADSNFFDMFGVEMVQGNPKTALRGRNNVVISEAIALKYFGNENPIDKKLKLDNYLDVTVTGTYKNMPTNMHFNFDLMISMETLEESRRDFWMGFNFPTYIVLQDGASPEALTAKFPAMIEKYIGPEIEKFIGVSFSEFLETGNGLNVALQPVQDIHLHSDLMGELGTNSDIKYIYIFSAIALFILLIACINFMNLSTARSANRAKEVGVRKVMGSLKKQLVYQFIAESTLVSFISFMIAAGCAWLLLEPFSSFAGKELSFSLVENLWIVPFLFVGSLVVGLMAGSYPAFFLSSFQPVAVLKGKLKTGAKSGMFRSILVVFQFFVSIVLIVGTIVVFEQLQFVQNKKIGFDREQIMVLEDTYVIEREQIQSFKNELLRSPYIESISITGFTPLGGSENNNAYFPGDDPKTEQTTVLREFNVDFDYLKTFGMELAEGRDFDPKFGTDSSAIIINEATVKHFGWENPIGQQIGTFGNEAGDTEILEVIGVVKDFHSESLRDAIRPAVIKLGRSRGRVSMRIQAEHTAEILTYAREQWNLFAEGQPFTYDFMDDTFKELYEEETKIGEIFGVFAGLAIFTACLGLFGLASFTSEQRAKEIGVRKVLGASISGVVFLLSKEFGKLVLIAFAISVPVAWYAMDTWLADFAYRTQISFVTFLIAGFSAFAIAWLTMSYQTIKAASVNPVKSLRSE